jgi:hypothetical protein
LAVTDKTLGDAAPNLTCCWYASVCTRAMRTLLDFLVAAAIAILVRPCTMFQSGASIPMLSVDLADGWLFPWVISAEQD